MPFRIVKPTGILSTVIDYYWIVENRENRSVYREMVYPQAFHQMMFYFGQPFTQENADGSRTRLPQSCICGMKDRFVHVEVTSGFGLLGVVFRPHAARQVLGIPLFELKGTSLALGDWFGTAGSELEERIFLSRCHHDRIAILEAFLISRLTEPAYDQRRIEGAVRMLSTHPGLVTLKSLAEMACLSERQFERTFTGFVGLPPKKFHRIARLNFAIDLAGKSGPAYLTGIALAAGFYDQAHFNNEFREMTGLTPGQFFALQ